MSQSAQEDPRHLLSPPTRRETPSKRVSALTGGMSAPLHSSCADPISQWILLQACSTRSRGAGSPPKTSGGARTTLQSSYAQGNPLQACSGSHRRNVGALALLLCRWKPSPSVFRPAQEERGRLCSPPTHRKTPSKRVLTRTGGPQAPLHSSCADPISQWILLQECSTRSGGAGSPPKTSGGSQTSSQSSYAPYSSFASSASGIPPFPSRIPDK